ncbi:ATP-binding cassette domain-containing protein [Paraburkholderia metrosideri]|jgi:ABC-type sugar transport system ATPase subunit|uniref:Fructose import ATP-binding protein FrcA n=1 Tax=Paraburkholderia metrosideri TaxID=580937 RepID=A0ABN7I9Y0_9BURK|nr:ATP-binding cassette domain-containing protein [Paraburkholderia metrosideri]CAD6554144.1 Fructose import ATP-binding protein FrcA [Paraburkholderia metrosideri]
MRSEHTQPFMQLRSVGKRFGGVEALRNVDLDIHSGEVLGLLGDNGAGKTTLVKVLAGVHSLSSGEIWCKGQSVDISAPKVAHELGIETVFQDLAMVPNLGVTDNFFIGREITTTLIPKLIKVLRSKAMHADARETLNRLDIHIPSLKVSVDSLSGGQRQAVAIARAIRWKANLVILDEPTAALSVPEQNKVLELTRSLANQGVAVIYITHNMSDVLAVTDRIAVMYRGLKAGELITAQTSQGEIVEMIMSGKRSRA